MDNFFAFGFGVSTLSKKGMELDCYFPKPIIDIDSDTKDVLDELAIGAHEISAETAELLLGIHNASYTRFMVHGSDLKLAEFNAIPHLSSPDRAHARTYI